MTTNAQFSEIVAGLFDDLANDTITKEQFAGYFTSALGDWEGASFTKAAIANALTGYLNDVAGREEQITAWMTGSKTGGHTSANGGPMGGPYYPVMDPAGVTTYRPCPAFIIDTAINALAEIQPAIDASAAAVAAKNTAVASATTATDAATSAANAVNTFASFRKTWHGARSTPPTVDYENQPVIVGSMYFDTAATPTPKMKVLRSTGPNVWSDVSSVLSSRLSYGSAIATAGQTTFTITGGYDVGSVIITLNGRTLTPSEFTATSGTTVVFSPGLAVGDVVTWVGIGALDLANVYSKAETDAKYAKAGSGAVGVLSGLDIDSFTTTNVVDIYPGRAGKPDGSGTLVLSAIRTKTLAPWAQGSNQGCWDGVGTLAGTWLNLYLIEKISDGTVDVLGSIREASTTQTVAVPSGWQSPTYIGCVPVNGSNQFYNVTYRGKYATFDVAISSGMQHATTTAQNFGCSCPYGKVVRLRVLFQSINSGGTTVTSDIGWIITSLYEADSTFGNGNFTAYHVGTLVGSSMQNIEVQTTPTNASVRVKASVASARFYLNTLGWRDERGASSDYGS